jgi:anti-anti-sigma factor
MEIITKEHEKGLVVSVTGRMDAISAPEFEQNLMGLIDSGHTTVVIDCGDLVYITSAGLRSILTIAKALKGTGGTLKISALKDVVKKVYEISGFGAIIPTFETVETAFE